jgi:uncharacterized protein (TIGR02594 family)
MFPLPEQYKDLEAAVIIPIMNEALKLYGVRELAGEGNNPIILGWAKELNHTVKSFYTKDSIAWCGLFMGVCAKRAGYQPPEGFHVLRARSWGKWGDPIHGFPLLGDILIFERQGGGHVGLYVGEDKVCYHVLGGNQGDVVSIVRIPKERLVTARRSPMNRLPKIVNRVMRSGNGKISTNEA